METFASRSETDERSLSISSNAYWIVLYRRSSELLPALREVFSVYSKWDDFFDGYLSRREFFEKDWTPVDALKEVWRQQSTLRKLGASNALFGLAKALKVYFTREPTSASDRLSFCSLLGHFMERMVLKDPVEFSEENGLPFSENLRGLFALGVAKVNALHDRVRHHSKLYKRKTQIELAENYAAEVEAAKRNNKGYTPSTKRETRSTTNKLRADQPSMHDQGSTSNAKQGGVTPADSSSSLHRSLTRAAAETSRGSTNSSCDTDVELWQTAFDSPFVEEDISSSISTDEKETAFLLPPGTPERFPRIPKDSRWYLARSPLPKKSRNKSSSDSFFPKPFTEEELPTAQTMTTPDHRMLEGDIDENSNDSIYSPAEHGDGIEEEIVACDTDERGLKRNREDGEDGEDNGRGLKLLKLVFLTGNRIFLTITGL